MELCYILLCCQEERGSFSSEVCGLVLVYRPPHSKEEVSIQLKIVEQEDKAKHGKEWLLALKKVSNLVMLTVMNNNAVTLFNSIGTNHLAPEEVMYTAILVELSVALIP